MKQKKYEPIAKIKRLLQRTCKKIARSIILLITHINKIDLLSLAYKDIGILNFKGYRATGEEFLITQYLHTRIRKEQPIFFDAGANIGEYALLLRASFPLAQIFAFEPNQATYSILEATSKKQGFLTFPFGFSSTQSEREIFFTPENPTTQLASLYPDALKHISQDSTLSKTIISLTTIDEFCRSKDITHIDFLKIDTEGHEYEILRGAERMLSSKNIDIIQFEFNEMNIIARVFLKDFYDLLSDYSLYRLHPHALMPMGEYDPRNEIFQFQNIIAISKKLK